MDPFKIFRSLFKSKTGKEPVENRSDLGLGWLTNYGNGSITVSEESSLSFSAVWACVDAISSDLAMLPINIYERTDTGKRIAFDHLQFNLLKNEPHPLYTSFQFRKTLLAFALLWGNGYARIIRNESTMEVIAYRLRHYWNVSSFIVDDEPWYKDHLTGDVIPGRDMIHLRGLSTDADGCKGKSPIQVHRETIGGGLAGSKFKNKFYQNGAHVSGVIQHPQKMSQPAHDRLSTSFSHNYSGMDNIGKVPILEEGAEFKNIGMPLKDAQFVEGQKLSGTEVARIYRVPPHKIADLEKATFSNIEQQSIEYVLQALMPWANNLEQELNRKIFKENEKGRFYTKIELNGLLRGDNQSRAEFYNVMLTNGVFNRDDVRSLEDMNPIPGGDIHLVPLNMIPLSKVLTYYDREKTGDTGS